MSPQTIKSYSFALKMFIGFLHTSYGIKPERIEFRDFNIDSIKGFLTSLAKAEYLSPNTYNQRLSALKTFVRYAILEYPAFLQDGQRILAMPSKRSSPHEITYLEKDAMKAFLAVPDQTTVRGRRDLAIIAMLYDTGARIQEFINIKVKDVRLEKPETVKLLGKGRKIRVVPIMAETAKIVGSYMNDRGFLEQSASGDLYLFNSPNRAQFTRPGISKILKRDLTIAKVANPTILFPEDIHPHAFPHTYIGQILRVIEVNNLLKIYFKDQQIALHTVNRDTKGAHFTDKSHYPSSKNISAAELLSRYKAEMQLIGGGGIAFCEKYEEHIPSHGTYHRTLAGILSLRKKYTLETIDRACFRACYYGNISYRAVKKICEAGIENLPLAENVTETCSSSNVRDMSLYREMTKLGVIGHE